MAKPRSTFVCQACGSSYPRWAGRCEACGEWNSIVEEATVQAAGSKLSRRGKRIEFAPLEGSEPEPPRRPTGIGELDRVTGGGLVRGSALLVGGDPGIGKSTLLLQAVTALAKSGKPAVYISGEEGVDQTRLRAKRLGLEDSKVQLAAETSLRDILTTLDAGNAPAALV